VDFGRAAAKRHEDAGGVSSGAAFAIDASPQIPLIEINAVLFQELSILLLECLSLMMSLLLLNVFAHG